MDVRPQIVIDAPLNSPAVRTLVEQEIDKLGTFHKHITSCKVAIASSERRHNKGGLYSVRITLHLPRKKEIVINHSAGDKPEQEHIGVAVREAFAKARRQIQDSVRVLRGDVKAHEAPLHGRVAKLAPEKDHGFIATADGLEIYFHRNSLVDVSFDALVPGTEVRFSAAEGEKGPQATTVHIIGKHHLG
jgi:cold shock CspA family protein/ribosome-associated translation inhibitor RaiA